MNKNTNEGRRNFLVGSGLGLAALATTASAQNSDNAEEVSPKILKDQVALVTGAARGIGKAIAVALAEAGANIVALDIAKDIDGHGVKLSRPDDLKATVTELEELGVKATSIQADIRDLKAMQAAVQTCVNKFGMIDILIANAGIAGDQPFLKNEDADYSRHWGLIADVNIKGTANTLRAVLPQLAKQRSGRVVMTSSTFGRHGNAANPAYVSSKWATTGLMKAAALEMGPHNVTVNAIAPTGVQTGLTGGLSGDELAAANKFFKESYHALPVGILQPEDIAGAAVFLASPWAARISGSTIDVAAGANARYTA